MKNKKLENKNKKFFHSGFLMVEAVIAIFVAGGVFIVFFAVMSSMYNNEFQQRDYIRAANLAQEGIEIARNIRDNNLKKNDGTSAFQGLTASACASSPYPAIPDPKFTRTISIGGSSTDSRSITSRVTWIPKGSTTEKTIVVDDILYSWGEK